MDCRIVSIVKTGCFYVRMPSFERSPILFLYSISKHSNFVFYTCTNTASMTKHFASTNLLTCVPSYVRTMLGMANYPGHSSLTAVEIMRLKDAFQEYSSSKRREQIIKEVSDYEFNVNWC